MFNHVEGKGNTTYLNSKPEHGENHATNYREVAQPETEGSPVNDRECDVKAGTNCSIENHGYLFDFQLLECVP